MSGSQQCFACAKTEDQLGRGFSRCSICRQAWYCDRQCQANDWKRHKPLCTPAATISASPAATSSSSLSSPSVSVSVAVSSVSSLASTADEGRELLQSVSRTCQAVYEAQNLVTINEAALASFVDGLKGEAGGAKVRKLTKRVPYPLQFSHEKEEVNFHCMLALLRGGGHYEPILLKASGGNTRADCNKFGLIGLHLSRRRLDAAFMSSANAGDISTNFNIPTHEMAPSEIPGVEIQKPGPLVPLVEDIKETLQTTGARLQQLGCSDLASFVLSCSAPSSANSSAPSAGALVRGLSMAFPAFQDETVVQTGAGGGGGVMKLVMLKNAQWLAAELHHRLRHKVPELDFSADLSLLTPIADADVLTTLINLEILVPKGGQSKATAFNSRNTDILRAASVHTIYMMMSLLADSTSTGTSSLAADDVPTDSASGKRGGSNDGSGDGDNDNDDGGGGGRGAGSEAGNEAGTEEDGITGLDLSLYLGALSRSKKNAEAVRFLPYPSTML